MLLRRKKAPNGLRFVDLRLRKIPELNPSPDVAKKSRNNHVSCLGQWALGRSSKLPRL